MHDRELRLAAAAHDPHDAVADIEARGTVTQRLDDARQLEAGDVRRAAGRRRIAPGELHLVGAVEARAAHADEHLTGPGDGVRMFFDEDLAVADGGCSHERRSLAARAVARGSRLLWWPYPPRRIG